MISYDFSQYSRTKPGEFDSFYVHLETKNKSFLDMHYYLKQIGLKNNAFMLKLYNTNLIGVDPHDPNLTPYQKAAILKECMDNCWYFMREVVRIPVSGANKPYVLHRGNLAMSYLFLMNINQITELSRQFYKTHSALVLLLWAYNFGTNNSQTLFYHKDFNSAKALLKDMKEIRDLLPSYLQFSSSVSNTSGKKLKVPDTVQSVQNAFNHNSISCMASARSKEAADKAGRGATVAFVMLDEFHFLRYNQYLWAALAPAHSRAAINAEENGKPHSIIITSTPGDMSTEEGQFGFTMRNQATPWNELYYDFPRQQIYKIRDSNTNSPFFLITFTYQQLGGGVQYFNDICRLMLRDWPKIRREVLLSWEFLPSNSAFQKEMLDKIKDFVHDPIRTIFFGQYNQYQMQIYEEIDLRYPPIIGVDVSGALYNDSSAITVIDSRTTRVCAILNCNYIPSDDLADVIYVLVSKYMPNAICCVERNGGFGVSVLQRLCKTSIKKNLYYEIKEKVIEESFNGVRVDRKKARVKVYGLDSTKETRARLIELLHERVQYHKDKFISPLLHHELETLEVDNKGKTQAIYPNHDDQVFSYLMALYVWYEGKDLAENFGIMKNTLKTDEDVEVLDNDIDRQESLEKIPLEKIDVDQELLTEDDKKLDKMINEQVSDMKTFAKDQYEKEQEAFNQYLLLNKSARQAYEKKYNVMSVENQLGGGLNYIRIPDEMFGNISDDTDEEIAAQMRREKNGNLFDIFSQL